MKSINPSHHRDTLRQVSTLAAILAGFGINTLSNLAPIGGMTIAEISNTVLKDVLITPANYAFAIWGVIYVGLFSFGIYQLSPKQRSNPELRHLGYLLVWCSLAQIFWVVLFQLRFFALSVAAMLGILIPLILAYLRLGIGKRRVSETTQWLVHLPLSIYLAWISVATIVNVAIALFAANWQGWGIQAPVWTALMCAIAAALGAIVCWRGRDLAFPSVAIWALFAIAIRHQTIGLIAGTAGGLASLLLGFVAGKILRRSMRRHL
jgi:hypothetical protein